MHMYACRHSLHSTTQAINRDVQPRKSNFIERSTLGIRHVHRWSLFKTKATTSPIVCYSCFFLFIPTRIPLCLIGLSFQLPAKTRSLNLTTKTGRKGDTSHLGPFISLWKTRYPRALAVEVIWAHWVPTSHFSEQISFPFSIIGVHNSTSQSRNASIITILEQVVSSSWRR